MTLYNPPANSIILNSIHKGLKGYIYQDQLTICADISQLPQAFNIESIEYPFVCGVTASNSNSLDKDYFGINAEIAIESDTNIINSFYNMTLFDEATGGYFISGKTIYKTNITSTNGEFIIVVDLKDFEINANELFYLSWYLMN